MCCDSDVVLLPYLHFTALIILSLLRMLESWLEGWHFFFQDFLWGSTGDEFDLVIWRWIMQKLNIVVAALHYLLYQMCISHWLTKLARRWRLWKRPKLVRQVWPLSVDTFPFALLWLVVKDQLCCYIIFAVLKTGQECLGICIKRGFNVKFVFPQVTVVYQYGDWYTTDLCYIRVQQIGACPYSCFLVSDVRTSPLEAYVIHLRRIRYN